MFSDEFVEPSAANNLQKYNVACMWQLTLTFNYMYYGTKSTTAAEPMIRLHHLHYMKNYKLRVLSNKCCLDFNWRSIDERGLFSLLRYYLRPLN